MKTAADIDLEALRTRFRARLERLPAPFRRGSRPWLIGFSHGADSTALLTLLYENRDALPPLLVRIVDHGLRAGSTAEARRARAFAEGLGFGAEILRVEPTRVSETAARRERYRAFRDAAERTDARALALAHHDRDQLETVLLRLARGSGPLGLCGMPSRRALTPRCDVVRPLLREDPKDLRRLLDAKGHAWIEDETNRDTTWTPRNRVRHETLPALRARDPEDRALRRLMREARGLRRAVRHEVRDYHRTSGYPSSTSKLYDLPLAERASPWTRESIALEALDRLGLRRPTRHLARRFAQLLGPDARTGNRVESRGRWCAERRRDHVQLTRLV